MMIGITAAALKHLQKQRAAHEGAPGFVFSTTRSGCSGLAYVLELATTVPSIEDYLEQIIDGLTLYIEKKSQPYLAGVKIDFQQEGLQSKIVFINPNETGRCGCGESFSVNEN